MLTAWLLPAALFLSSAPAPAQIFDQSDWKESAAPPPPAFDADRLVSVEMPAYMSLRYGIDPKTLRIDSDGVVRYVVVARSRRDEGGAFNAFYEGIRCATQEVKTYARSSGSGWESIKDPSWEKMSTRSRHVSELARQGICRGNAPRASVNDMVQHFKQPVRELE